MGNYVPPDRWRLRPDGRGGFIARKPSLAWRFLSLLGRLLTVWGTIFFFVWIAKHPTQAAAGVRLIKSLLNMIF